MEMTEKEKEAFNAGIDAALAIAEPRAPNNGGEGGKWWRLRKKTAEQISACKVALDGQ